jgi:hypothetical protein
VDGSSSRYTDDRGSLVPITRRRSPDSRSEPSKWARACSGWLICRCWSTREATVISEPKTYIHVGRTDDIVVFSNGEKTNPASFQDEVARHPEIRAALVVGQQCQEAALLVEPTDRQILSEQAKQELVERVWPTVEECNSRCPKHAKVSKTKILIAPASVPFFRAGKGTVQRQSTLVAFKPRIDSLYDEDNEQGTSWMPDAHVEPLAIEDVMAAVSRGLVIVKCNVNSPTSDFFANGMDSLQETQL